MNLSNKEESVSISPEALSMSAVESQQEYYAIPGCEGLLQQLLHLLRFGEGLPIVQAGRSAGKSSMASALRNRLADCSCLSLISCDQDQDLADLLEQITAGLGLHSGPGAGESLATLRQFSTQIANNHELAVLVIDDAHCMDDQSLGAILSLLQGNNFPGYGMHMVFFSAPGLVERVDEIGLLDAPVYDFEIPLFSPSELSGFLKSHFPEASASKLSAGAVQQIWSQSMGSPGVALRIFKKILLESTNESSNGLDFLKTVPKAHLIALAVLIAVLLWAGFMREKSTSDGKLSVKTEQIEKPDSITFLDSSDKKEASTNTKEKSSSELPKPSSQTLTNSDLKPTETPSTVTRPGQNQNQLTTEKTIGEQAPSSIQAQLKEKLDEKSAINADIGAKNDVGPKKEPKLIQPPPGKSLPPTKMTHTGPSGLTANELFLMDQSPDTFTLQIIAASRKDALEKYMAAQENRNDLFLYQALREGRAWFVVVTGIFTSRQEALQAVAGLPETQKKGGPWPRQLTDIQSEIAANRSK